MTLSILALVASFAYLFRDVIGNLVKIWIEDGNYSHGFLVPIVVGYFIWLKKDELRSAPIAPFWPAVVLVVVSGLLLLAGQLAVHGFTQHFSLLLMVFSLTLLVFGIRWFKILAGPLLFLVFMFPLPFFLKKSISEPLQLLSSTISVNFLHLVGYPIYREGNILHLSDTILSVAEACSGLRSIVALVFASSVLGYFTFTKKWKIVIPVLGAFFVAIILNWVRITGTVVLSEIWGSEKALKFFHDFSGIIVIFVSIVVLTALILYIKKGEKEPKDKYPHDAKPIAPDFSKKSYQALLVACVSLISMSLYANNIFSVKAAPLDIGIFPLKMGGYIGKMQEINAGITEGTGVTDDLSVVYTKDNALPIYLYLGYYRTEKANYQFIHSPDSCIPGSGWKILKNDVIEIQNEGQTIKAKQYFSENNGTRNILITWVQSGDHAISDHRDMVKDALMRGMFDGRLDDAVKVMISTNITETIRKDEAEEKLIGFAKLTHSKLLDIIEN